VQDGGIHIELINWPFLHELRGSPAEYKACLDFAIQRGWLWLRERYLSEIHRRRYDLVCRSSATDLQYSMHIVTGRPGIREGLEWRAGDPYSASARMEGPPRSNKAVTPAEAGAGRTGKCDNERNVSCSLSIGPGVRRLDGIAETYSTTILILVPPPPKLGL
jgi:hypothetical protein